MAMDCHSDIMGDTIRPDMILSVLDMRMDHGNASVSIGIVQSSRMTQMSRDVHLDRKDIKCKKDLTF